MYASKTLKALPLVGLLALPFAANARTINLFETDDGHQSVPGNASPVAEEKNPYADLAEMSIADIISMEINGKPVVVQLHIPPEQTAGNGGEVIVFSSEYPEGIPRAEWDNSKPPAVPLPAAAWLMMSGLVGLTAIARRRHQDEAVG